MAIFHHISDISDDFAWIFRHFCLLFSLMGVEEACRMLMLGSYG